MEKSGVGAKPKTGTGTASNGTQGTSESSRTRSNSNSRGSKQDNANQGSYAQAYRSTRSSNINNSSTTGTKKDSTVLTNDNIARKGSVPNSVVRNKVANNARSTAQRPTQSLSEYSPIARQPGQSRGTDTFKRPVLGRVNANNRAKNSDSSKKVEKSAPLSPASTDTSSTQSSVSVDTEPVPKVSDSEPGPSQDSNQQQESTTSNTQPTANGLESTVMNLDMSLESPYSRPAEPLSTFQDTPPAPSLSSFTGAPQPLSSFRGTGLTYRQDATHSRTRPMSTSRDAVLARQMMQEEMDAMMNADEELARQLSEELNGGPHPPRVFFRPLRPLGMDDSREDSSENSSPEAHSPPPFPPVFPRGRHYPSRPTMMTRGEELRRRRGRGGGMHIFMRSPGGQAIRVAGGGGEGGGLGPMHRLLMGGLGRRGQRSSGDSPEEEGAALPQGEFDPEQRLLAGGHPEDFLSIMHDPSLMLLMLLLRAPETLNEGGVDLDDYEGLWELAERLGEVRRRGITEDEINRLPTHKFRPESDGEKADVGAAAAEVTAVQCQICLVDFETGDSLRGIPCKHDFHKDCIDEWLKRNATCPICRQEIKPS